MKTFIKSLFALSIVALLASPAIADDKQGKSGNAMDRQSELRKGVHDHVNSNMSSEELERMHHRVREQMEKMNPVEREMLREELNKENDGMTPEQRAALRKQMHDHVNSKMTTDELEEMHMKVRENMQNKPSGDEKK